MALGEIHLLEWKPQDKMSGDSASWGKSQAPKEGTKHGKQWKLTLILNFAGDSEHSQILVNAP